MQNLRGKESELWTTGKQRVSPHRKIALFAQKYVSEIRNSKPGTAPLLYLLNFLFPLVYYFFYGDPTKLEYRNTTVNYIRLLKTLSVP